MTKPTWLHFQECQGRTVKGIGLDGNLLVIAFVDGAYTSFSADEIYDGTVDIDPEEARFDSVRWSLSLLDSGLISQDEFNAIELDNKRLDAIRKREQLEQLERDIARRESKL